MTQLEVLLDAIKQRGGSITTAEILDLKIAQYGRVISDLRKRGYNIVCEPIRDQKRNNLFTLVKAKQLEITL